MKICIICGNGQYPVDVAKSCVEKNIDFCFLKIFNNSIPDTFDKKTCDINFGEIKTGLTFLKSQNVTHIIFAGHMQRPKINEISLDTLGIKWLAKLGTSFFSGDDTLLRRLSDILEAEGFKIISGTELLNNVFLNVGIYNFSKLKKTHSLDISRGFNVAKSLGQLDVGQAVIVFDGNILGVEAAEGTDELIKRCSKLRHASHGGLLVKVCKPQQDIRLDLPTVGINTLKNLIAHNFEGLVIEANKCIVLDKDNFLKLVIDYGLTFISANKDFIDNEFS